MDGTRRSFLKAAVTAAGQPRLLAVRRPSSVAPDPRSRAPDGPFRSRRCESSRWSRCSSKRGSSIVPPSMRSSTRWSTRSARATAPASWRAPGSIPPTRDACSRMRRRRSPNWATPAARASTCWSSRTRPRFTTWSSARCAPAIRGRCWACRRSGTSRRRTARARSSIRAASSGSSEPSGRRRRGARLGQHRGAALPRAARTSRRHRTDDRRSNWPRSSRAMRWLASRRSRCRSQEASHERRARHGRPARHGSRPA